MWYDFALEIDTGTTDPESEMDRLVDPLFEAFEGDVSPSIRSGVLMLACTLEAGTLEDAIRPVLAEARRLGLNVRQIHVEPEGITA